MKKIVSFTFVLMSICIFVQKNAGNTLSSERGSVISWERTFYDFGIIKREDGIVKYKFVFVNTGDEPLVLEKVKVTCGCTSSNYSKEPVAQNTKGFVEVVYDPVDQSGEFNKKITVITNEKTMVASSLEIKGNVISK